MELHHGLFQPHHVVVLVLRCLVGLAHRVRSGLQDCGAEDFLCSSRRPHNLFNFLFRGVLLHDADLPRHFLLGRLFVLLLSTLVQLDRVRELTLQRVHQVLSDPHLILLQLSGSLGAFILILQTFQEVLAGLGDLIGAHHDALDLVAHFLVLLRLNRHFHLLVQVLDSARGDLDFLDHAFDTVHLVKELLHEVRGCKDRSSPLPHLHI
mmetsp:Transcript_24841/g.72779  ORF Transcript_24841/g.72779 Transcript_24841/m.72779 type:complete len:208 (-) Transcript_24841:217-840(-)